MAFTPETRFAIDAFEATHQQVFVGDRVYYRPTCLPHTGGALDQDAWLMDAIEWTRECHNDLLRERERQSPPTDQ